MRFFTTITAFLAAGFAVASPITSGQDVQVVEARAEDYSLSDINSQLKTIKGLIEKDFSGCKIIRCLESLSGICY